MLQLAFYRAKYGNWQDKAISYITWGPFSHVELVFDGKVWFSSSPRDGGTRFKRISPAALHWEYITISCSVKVQKEIYQWCVQEVNKSYDWLGICTAFLNLRSDNNKWFCSEICAQALLNAQLLKYRSNQLSPNKLYGIMQKSLPLNNR
jgi:uncharacterized protein YycO